MKFLAARKLALPGAKCNDSLADTDFLLASYPSII